MSAIQIVERDFTDAEFARRCAGGDEHAVDQGSAPLSRASVGVVALEGDAFVGCATMEVYRHAGACTGWSYLADLYVEKPYRRQGLGSILLRRVEDQVFGLGVRQVSTATAGYEGPGFYRKQGYRVCYEREQHFPSGHATVGLRKALQPSRRRAPEPLPASLGGVRIEDRTMTDAEFARMNEGFVEHALEFGNPRQTRERHGFMACVGDTFIGCVSGLAALDGYNYNNWFMLSDLFVEKPYRGQGLGTALLRGMEERIRSLGSRFIYTRTAGFESPGFFGMRGYEVLYEFERWYPGGFSLYGLRKTL